MNLQLDLNTTKLDVMIKKVINISSVEHLAKASSPNEVIDNGIEVCVSNEYNLKSILHSIIFYYSYR